MPPHRPPPERAGLEVEEGDRPVQACTHKNNNKRQKKKEGGREGTREPGAGFQRRKKGRPEMGPRQAAEEGTVLSLLRGPRCLCSLSPARSREKA